MSLSRRVINELRRDWTELWQCKNNIFHVKQENNATMFQIFFEGNYNPIYVTLDFNNGGFYPFRPPKVYIGLTKKKEYISLLPTSWSFQEKILGKKCLCCHSVLCHWGPSKTMMDIITEIKENFILKIRMIEIAHCRKIVEKKFNIDYLPIEEYL